MPDFTVLYQYPAPGELQVRDDASISGAVSATQSILSIEGSLNGERMLVSSGMGKMTWSRPNYSGDVTYVHPKLFFTVKPRRRFDPDTNYVVSFTFGFFNGDQIATETVTYAFHTAPQLSQVETAYTQPGVLDNNISDFKALNSLRSHLVDALKTRAGAPNAEVLLYSRIMRSTLHVVVPKNGKLLEISSRLVPADLASPMVVDAEVRKLGPFWQASLYEAAQLGVPAPTLELLDKAMQAPYPQERVGAAAALLVLCAQLL